MTEGLDSSHKCLPKRPHSLILHPCCLLRKGVWLRDAHTLFSLSLYFSLSHPPNVFPRWRVTILVSRRGFEMLSQVHPRDETKRQRVRQKINEKEGAGGIRLGIYLQRKSPARQAVSRGGVEFWWQMHYVCPELNSGR